MPVLSVVVPTHNRADYAISCIEAVLGFGAPDLQLVMTDTSTDRRLFGWLHNGSHQYLDDSRFIYRKIDEPSNVTKNHNDAMALAGGEYVCVIGDDDCITSAAIDAARWASTRSVPVVSQPVTAVYGWPDFRSRLVRAGHAARLYVPRRARAIYWRNGEVDLRAAMRRAFQFTDGMPRCYHGIVRRELLESVRSQTGTYFHGPSPDMSAAVALACLVHQYCEVEIPLTIAGVSGGSASGRSAMNTHKGDLSSENPAGGLQDKGWSIGVPRVYAVETVWADAGLQTLGKLRPDLLQGFNYARLFALCNVRHPEFRSKVDEARREVEEMLGRDLAKEIAREIRQERWARFKYLARRMMRPTVANGRRNFGGLPTVADASRCYERYARSNGFTFDKVSQ